LYLSLMMNQALPCCENACFLEQGIKLPPKQNPELLLNT